MSAPTAVITGAGQGLGRAMAQRLRADGYAIVVLDIDLAAAQATAAPLDGRAFAVDVTDASQVDAVAADLGDIAVLVNNAGIYRLASYEASSVDDLRAVVEVNIMGTALCTRAFAAGLRAGDGGAIVNLSAGAAVTCSPGLGTYPATKAAIEAMTKQTALELAPLVRVNAVAPGMVQTEGTAGSYTDGRADRRAKAVPLGRVGDPTDIADVVGFLCSPAARYVTGQVIGVDGGVSAGRSGL